jgi:Tfp pilus assembly protein PilX
MAVLVLVVVLTLVNLAVISGVAGAGDDSQAAALRVETMRAFYAAEGAATVVSKSLISQATKPTAGSTVSVGGPTMHFVTVPTGAGTIVVEGRAGFARRRVSLVTQ